VKTPLLPSLLAAVLIGCDQPAQPNPPRPRAAFSLVIGVSVTDLGLLPGDAAGTAVAINDRGEVVGFSARESFVGERHAFLRTAQAGMRSLGTLGGASSQATDINELGQVVGFSQTESGENHAFLWTADAGFTDLGTLGWQSFAVGVNNLGQVVGFSYLVPGQFRPAHAFVWTREGGMVDIGTLGGTLGIASGVNDLGQVVGSASPGQDGPSHAFLWTEAVGMADLGTLGGDFSRANRINNFGQVVGGSRVTSEQLALHAFLWTGEAGMVDLGTLGGDASEAIGVNDFGMVVGGSALVTGQTSPQHAFLWTEAGGLEDLGTLGGDFAQAADVNDRGQVVGLSTPPGSTVLHPTLWTLTFSAPPPAALVSQVVTGVSNLAAAGALNSGEADALLAKLEAVTRQLDRGNPTAAANLLQAFINQVMASVNAGLLAPTVGQSLIDAAQDAINQLRT